MANSKTNPTASTLKRLFPVEIVVSAIRTMMTVTILINAVEITVGTPGAALAYIG